MALIAVAFYGLRPSRARWALALGAMLAGALAFGRVLPQPRLGAFFYFKILGFAGPMILALAVACLVRERAASAARVVRAGCVTAVALLAVSAVVGARHEVNQQFSTFTPDVRELGTWSRELPADDSILLALVPSGPQLNATRFLSDHPLSSPLPLGADVPVRAPGPARRLGAHRRPRPTRSCASPSPAGPLVRERHLPALRINPKVRGRDKSSRRAYENAPWGQAGVPPTSRTSSPVRPAGDEHQRVAQPRAARAVAQPASTGHSARCSAGGMRRHV